MPPFYLKIFINLRVNINRTEIYVIKKIISSKNQSNVKVKDKHFENVNNQLHMHALEIKYISSKAK